MPDTCRWIEIDTRTTNILVALGNVIQDIAKAIDYRVDRGYSGEQYYIDSIKHRNQVFSGYLNERNISRYEEE